MTPEPNATNPRPAGRGRAAYLEALQQIATDIASRVDASRLLQGVLERSVEVIGASGGLLSLLEPEDHSLVLKASVNAIHVQERMSLLERRGVSAEVWASGEAFITNAYQQFVGRVSGQHTEGVERVAAVPIRLAGVPVGMIQLFRFSADPPFEQHDLEWMRDFAELAAIAVDNARLREGVSRDLTERHLRETELNRQLRETRLLRQVSQAASASLEPLVVLTNICRELAGAIGVPQAAFARLADDGSHLVVVAEHRPPGVVGLGIAISLANNAVTERAIASREPVAVFDAQHDPEMAAGRMTAAQLGIQSMLIVPIVAGDEVIGTLGLDSLEPRVFTDEDIHLARTVASAAAPALEHARLFEALKLELAERRRIEAALRASEARHRALIDAVPDAIYRLGADARIIDARIPGQSARRLIGKRLGDVLPVSIAQRALEAVRQAQRERTVQAFDERLAPAFGASGAATHRDVEMRFAPIGDDSVVMLERDITNRKRAERELHEQQARFEELVDSVDGIVWEVRLHDGLPRLEYVSRRAEPLLGVPVDQLLGDNRWVALIHPEDRETVMVQAIRAMESRQGLELEHRMIDAGGLEHWFHNRASVLMDRNRAVGLRGLATDITARKQFRQLEDDRNRVLELAARGGPLDVVMGLITAMLVRQFPDAACCIMQLGRGQLEMLGATGLSQGLSNRLRQMALGVTSGPLGQTAMSADLTDVHDLLHDQRWSEAWRSGVLDEGFRSLASVPIRSATGSVIGVLGMFGRRPGLGAVAAEQMVSAADLASIALEKHLLTQRLEFQALHDALTGLPNRTLFADRLRVALAQAQRHGSRVALLYVDLDGFKPVNDQFGHSVGDALLREIAARLVACVRASDTVARLGGDEFCVILGDLAAVSEAVPVALKIVQAVADVTRLGEREVRVRASVGLAAFPDHASDADTLYRLSDQAMYRAKNAGGHRLAIHANETILEP